MNVPIEKKPLSERKDIAPKLARAYYRYFRTQGESKSDAKIIVRNIIEAVLR